MASAPCDLPVSASTATSWNFLVVASALCRAVWTLHQDCTDVSATSSLRDLVHDGDARDALRAPSAVDSATGTDDHAACAKIGLDLILHLDRLAASSLDLKSLDEMLFTELWSLVDVSVLKVRLDALFLEMERKDGSSSQLLIEQCQKNLSFKTDDKIIMGLQKHTTDEREMGLKKQEADAKLESVMAKRRLMGIPNVNIPNRPMKVPQRAAPAGLLNDFILETLAYKSMYDREAEVEKAHKSTFDWVFNSASAAKDKESSKAEIKQWLATDDLGPIYWITGKPGSGKSTLIEFLFHHRSAGKYLQHWAAGRPVCMAGFFFWTSGSREQRSQTGLLRSLLHQILYDCQELIALVFPDLWARLQFMSTKERVQLKIEWTVEELMTAFHIFVTEATKTMNICLFVDGLDEFDGDHNKIISLFKDLSTGNTKDHIKMCLSSRPWAVFESAFQHSVPNLRLQDLTYNDMYIYVSEKLRQDRRVASLFGASATEETQLVNTAVKKSDGVFLWVRLAVERMLDSFERDKNMGSLKAALEALPTELDDLFNKLLFTDQTQEELEQSANIYHLLRARESVADFIRDDSSNALTVWELAFALRKVDDEAALDMSVEEATEAFVDERCGSTEEAIRKRFTGLLGLQARKVQGNLRKPRFANPSDETGYDKAEKRVFYIHRTVRDWLVSAKGVHDHLVSSSSVNFDGHLRLLRSYVLRLKRPLEEIEHHRRLDEWWPDIALALTHARHITNDNTGQQMKFVNELNKTLCWWWDDKPADPYDHWARNSFGSYEVRMKAPPIWQPFLCLAVKFGLTNYVMAEVAARSTNDHEVSEELKELQSSDSTPLLVYATELLCSRQKTIYPLSDPVLVEYLLRNESRINPGPNDEYKDFITKAKLTPWLMLLKTLRNGRRRNFIDYYDVQPDGVKRWTSIVKLFLQVGKADANAVVRADAWDPEITAEEVLQLLEDTYGATEVHETKELLKSLK